MMMCVMLIVIRTDISGMIIHYTLIVIRIMSSIEGPRNPEYVSREKVRELIRAVLMPGDLTNKGGEDIVYINLNEHAENGILDPNNQEALANRTLDILAKREGLKLIHNLTGTINAGGEIIHIQREDV